MARYEIALTITAKDAGPEDVVQIAQTISQLASRTAVSIDPQTRSVLKRFAGRTNWQDKLKALADAMELCRGNREAAAKELGISPSTLCQWEAKARGLEP